MGLYERLRIKSNDIGKKSGEWTQIGPSFIAPCGGKRRRMAVHESASGEVRAIRLDFIGPDGMRKQEWTPEYISWRSMINRCERKQLHNYGRYGGRGIRVCELWRKSFVSFLEHVGPKPTPKHTLDRINPDGNYEPGNVRWATSFEQAANKSKRKVSA